MCVQLAIIKKLCRTEAVDVYDFKQKAMTYSDTRCSLLFHVICDLTYSQERNDIIFI